MSRLNLLIATSLVALMGAAGAFADESQPVTWDQLKEMCKNAGKPDDQRAPKNMVAHCTDTTVGWVQAAPGEMNLPGMHKVTTQVTAKGLHTNPCSETTPIESKGGMCTRFNQVERTLLIELPITCDDVNNAKGGETELCDTLVAKEKGNGKLVDEKVIGHLDTCGGGGDQHEKPKP
jgi:hypothetical protein